MKKFLAVIFSVALLISTIATVGFADDETADPEGTIFFEFEDLAEQAGAGNIQTEEQLEDKALSVEYASGKSYWATIGTQTDPSATLTFDVAVGSAGYYKVQYAAMKRTDAANLSNMSLFVNNEFVGDNEANCTELEDLTVYDTVDNGDGTTKQNRIYPWAWANMSLFEGSGVCYLTEGQNTLRVDVSELLEAQYGKWKFFADYIKFIPTAGTEIASEGSTIEAESMSSQFVEDITGASGGKWIGHQKTKDAITPIKTLVTFPESRYYDVTYVATDYATAVSEISLYLDSEKIGSNKDDADVKTNVQDRFTGEETNAQWTKEWCNMQEYTKKVWIEAGTYMFEIQIANCEAESESDSVKYFVDCIRFKPTADFISKDSENNYTAGVSFSKPVSGVALMAAYNGKELVKISEVPISEAAQYVETTLQTDETVTNVKIFVWDGTENCIPQIECKELTVTQ